MRTQLRNLNFYVVHKDFTLQRTNTVNLIRILQIAEKVNVSTANVCFVLSEV